MKTSSFFRCFAWGAAGALITCASSVRVEAQWGSIRGNNREKGHEERGHEEHAREERAPMVRREAERPREVVRPIERQRVDRDRHLWDWDADRRQGYYWSGYHPGMRLSVLPQGYLTVNLGGQPYYYYQGVYYQPGMSGYTVVTPPTGVVVAALPPGAQGIAVNGSVYYHAGGAFYVQQPNGFVVVPPPLGVTVPDLPPGAVPVTINGMIYYLANNVYYLPVMQNGITMYTVARP